MESHRAPCGHSTDGNRERESWYHPNQFCARARNPSSLFYSPAFSPPASPAECLWPVTVLTEETNLSENVKNSFPMYIQKQHSVSSKELAAQSPWCSAVFQVRSGSCSQAALHTYSMSGQLCLTVIANSCLPKLPSSTILKIKKSRAEQKLSCQTRPVPLATCTPHQLLRSRLTKNPTGLGPQFLVSCSCQVSTAGVREEACPDLAKPQSSMVAELNPQLGQIPRAV